MDDSKCNSCSFVDQKKNLRAGRIRSDFTISLVVLLCSIEASLNTKICWLKVIHLGSCHQPLLSIAKRGPTHFEITLFCVLFSKLHLQNFFASKSISICTTFCSTPFWAVFTVGGPYTKWKKKERYKKWLPVAYNSYLILSPPLRWTQEVYALWCKLPPILWVDGVNMEFLIKFLWSLENF